MIVTLIGTVGLIVTALIGVLGGRNDRAQANLEAELLAKLHDDADAEAAKRLREVIHGRIARWHRKMFKPDDPKLPDTYGEKLAESMKLRTSVGNWPIWLAAIIFAVLFVGGIVLAIVTNGHGTPPDPGCLLLLCPGG